MRTRELRGKKGVEVLYKRGIMIVDSKLHKKNIIYMNRMWGKGPCWEWDIRGKS